MRYCFLWSRAAVNLFSPLRQTKQTARVARNNLAPNQHVHKQSGSANIAEPVSVVMAVLVVLVESAAEIYSHRRANNHKQLQCPGYGTELARQSQRARQT